MATTETAIVDASALQKYDRRANGSPPPLSTKPPSKKLKRDQMLNERLNSLGEEAAKNPDPRFRELLQRIQVDTNLVQSFDMRSDRPLDAIEEEQLKLRQQSAGQNAASRGPQTLLEMCGPKFEDFVIYLQDLLEEKDYGLSKAKLDYEKKHSEFLSTHGFEIETANREHKMLRETTRDRIVNNIIAKKHKLMKEREGLEMNPESSALIFHPNQFSLSNPQSPGGTHGKRSTRQRREAEDVSGADKKRKRNGGDDDGSPAPQRRTLDTTGTTGTTAIWQGDRLASRKATMPVYSIDKLFTDKELAMTYNSAALQAHKYLQTHKPRYDENGQPVSSPEDSDSGDDRDEESELAAPAMERNMSHATRSTRGGPNLPENIMGLEALADFLPENYKRMVAVSDPKLPPTFPSTYIKNHAKHSDFNTPMALSLDDAFSDVLIMKGLAQHDQLHGVGSNFESELGSRTILEAVSQPAREHRFVAYLQGERPSESELRRRLDLPAHRPQRGDTDGEPVGSGTPSKTGRSGTPAQSSPIKGGGPTSAPALGGVPMSRQSSASGAPMSRSSSRKGGRPRG